MPQPTGMEKLAATLGVTPVTATLIVAGTCLVVIVIWVVACRMLARVVEPTPHPPIRFRKDA